MNKLCVAISERFNIKKSTNWDDYITKYDISVNRVNHSYVSFRESEVDLVLSNREINYVFADDIKDFVNDIIPAITKYKPRYSHQSMYIIIKLMMADYYETDTGYIRYISRGLKVITYGLEGKIRSRQLEYFTTRLSEENVAILNLAPSSLDRENFEQFIMYIIKYNTDREVEYEKTRIHKLRYNGYGNLVHYDTQIVFMSLNFHTERKADDIDPTQHHDYVAIGIQDLTSQQTSLASLLPLSQYHIDLCKEQNIKIVDAEFEQKLINMVNIISNLRR